MPDCYCERGVRIVDAVSNTAEHHAEVVPFRLYSAKPGSALLTTPVGRQSLLKSAGRCISDLPAAKQQNRSTSKGQFSTNTCVVRGEQQP